MYALKVESLRIVCMEGFGLRDFQKASPPPTASLNPIITWGLGFRGPAETWVAACVPAKMPSNTESGCLGSC